MAEPEAGMLTEHSQHSPLEGRPPESMRACAIHVPHAPKNVARESRLTLTTHAMCMPHDEIAHEGSQLSKLTAQDAPSSCSCHVGTSNARASFASFANWKSRRAVEREQEPTFGIEGGRYFLGILTAVITAFVGMAPGAAPPTRTHTKHDTALAVRVQVKVRKWHFELEHAFPGLRG
jgi:hypothetical protein